LKEIFFFFFFFFFHISFFPHFTTHTTRTALNGNKLYFSNYGSSGDFVDFVGSASSVDGSGAALFAVKGDVVVSGGGAVDVMHVRDIAVDKDSGDVFFTAYGGPSAAHIVRCTGMQRCTSIRKFDYSVTAQLLPSAIAYSSKLKRVFYAVADGSLERSVIYSSLANGDDVREFVVQSKDTGVAFPVGLAIDDENEYVYWANDVGPDRVQRGDLAVQAANVGTLYKKTDIRPFQIAVDPVGKFLYYVDQSSSPNAIGRIRTDVIDTQEQLRTLGTAAPQDIALDITGKNVYWSEVGSSTVSKGSVVDLGVAPSSSAASMALASVVALVSFVSMNF
jgi:hypothetical protein